ncbi:hypothetical protein M0805_001675 [Coniferiporia weirii]|nr:hypothetical protein M0805_001675 [Coniferiporia weirii]
MDVEFMGQRRPSLALLRAFVPLRPVAALRLTWVLTILWYEVGIFFWSVAGCRWPDAVFGQAKSSSGTQASPIHVLLVADPQVIDAHSYPSRTRWLPVLSQLVVDFNLRKSWTVVRRFAPDVVVFLGDMMDNGRLAYADEEYQDYYKRFKSIFPTDPSTEVYYIPGNHDVGLGNSHSFSPDSRKRYIANFGPPNYKLSVANHTLVMLDAPSLVEEDYRRVRTGRTFEDWSAPSGGTADFINEFASVGTEQPVILFTHIPLSRPDTASCGPLRERGTIRRGVGYGYQNTLGRDTSNYILKYIRPTAVYSGDDHDYCEYTHSIPLTSEGADSKLGHVREVTVKSISMAMGIRRPGFQLLSLASPSELRPNTQSFADVPCLLPDQLSIYLNRYLPLFLVSLLVLSVSGCRRVRARKVRPKNLDLDLTSAISPRAPLVSGYTEVATWNTITKDGVPSPESAPVSTARMPRNLSVPAPNGVLFAPTYRASSHTTPNTPDFGVNYGRFAPPGGPSAMPARLRAPSGTVVDMQDDSDGSDDDDDFSMVQTQSSRRRSGDFSYFSLSNRPGRRNAVRRLAWTWTFVFQGRRRRLTVGVPPLLEQVCCGWLGKNGRNARPSLLKLILRDFLATVWSPILVFVLIVFVMFR